MLHVAGPNLLRPRNANPPGVSTQGGSAASLRYHGLFGPVSGSDPGIVRGVAIRRCLPDSEADSTQVFVSLAENPGDIVIQKHELPGFSPEGPLGELFALYECSHPQLGIDWLNNLAATALDGREQALVYTATSSDGSLVAVPLRLGADQRSVHALANFYTSLYSPVASHECPVTLLTAVFRELAENRRLTTLTLAPMDPESHLYKGLLEALHAAGWRGVHTYFCFGNWIHPVEEKNWLAYLSRRPSRVRNTVKRKMRRFLEHGHGQLQIIHDEESLDEAIGHFTDIYNNSWKRDEPYPEFMPQLLRLAAGRGWLRLGLAHYEAVPVAAQAWLIVDGTAFIFKLAYRQDYRQLSPGTVLTAHMIRHVIETDRVGTIDYMSGDDSYKRDWMSVRRECRGIAAYNPRSLRGGALLVAHHLRSTLKHLIKRMTPE